MDRAAQISIMVIIGILLLAIVATTIVVVNKITSTKPKITPTYESELVERYTTKCLYDLGKEAFILIGERGGYIYPEKYGRRALKEFPTEGNAYYFGDEIVMPYWTYIIKGCTRRELIPPLEFGSNSIASQVSQYIKDNLPSCLGNYDDLKQQGIEVNYDIRSIDVEFGPSTTKIILDMPTTISFDEKETRLNEYEVELELPFKKIYEYAKRIVEEETYNGSFSEVMKRMVALRSYSEDIPPMGSNYDIVFSPNYDEMWSYEDVYSFISNVLLELNRMTTLESFTALSGADVNNKESIATYRNFAVEVLPIGENFDLNPLEVKFIYIPTKYNLLITPGYYFFMPTYKKIMPPNLPSLQLLNLLPSIYIKLEDFRYNMQVPVTVMLRSLNAFNGEGYLFNFGMELGLYNNEVASINKCRNITERISLPEEEFCNPLFFGGSSVDLYSTDKKDDFYVEYNCGDITCPIPLSYSGKLNNYYHYNLELPTCINGSLLIGSLNYLSQNLKLDSFNGLNHTLIVRKYPISKAYNSLPNEEGIIVNLYPLNYTVEVVTEGIVMEKGGSEIAELFIDTFYNIACGALADVCKWPQEKVEELLNVSLAPHWYITDKRISVPWRDGKIIIFLTPLNEYSLPAFTEITNENPIGEMKLIPGNYTLNMIYIHGIGENYTTKEIVLSQKVMGVKVVEEKINNSLLMGGAVLNESYPFVVTPEDLYTHKRLVFRYFVSDPRFLSELTDLQQVTSYNSLSEAAPEIIMPIWK